MHSESSYREDEHENQIKDLLVRLGILRKDQALPKNDGWDTGVAGDSTVYFFNIKQDRGYLSIVVKFDEKTRFKREKEALANYLKAGAFEGHIGPYGGATGLEKMEEALVYEAAHNKTKGSIINLEDLFLAQLHTNYSNCELALQKTLDVLVPFYGKIERRAHREESHKWPKIFRNVFSEAHQNKVLRLANKHGVNISNAFELDKTQTLHFSRVHGDINLTNALIAQDSEPKPIQALLIDFANSQADQPIVLDFAWLETWLWRQTAVELLSKWSSQDFLQNYLAALDWLDGRTPNWPDLAKPFHALVRLTLLIRQKLKQVVTEDLISQYFPALCLTQLHFLKFRDVYKNETRTLVALHGAQRSHLVYANWKAGRYKHDADDPLIFPFRQLQEEQTAILNVNTPDQEADPSEQDATIPEHPLFELVLNEIADLLDEAQLNMFRGALARTLDLELPPGKDPEAKVLAATMLNGRPTSMIQSVRSAIAELIKTYKGSLTHSSKIWHVAEQIVNWLPLIAVDAGWIIDAQQKIEPDQRIKLEMDILSQFGAEVAHAAAYGRPVCFIPDPQGIEVGLNCIRDHIDIEDGLFPSDKVDGLIREVWQAINARPWNPEEDADILVQTLDAQLVEERIDGNLFYSSTIFKTKQRIYGKAELQFMEDYVNQIHEKLANLTVVASKSSKESIVQDEVQLKVAMEYFHKTKINSQSTFKEKT